MPDCGWKFISVALKSQFYWIGSKMHDPFFSLSLSLGCYCLFNSAAQIQFPTSVSLNFLPPCHRVQNNNCKFYFHHQQAQFLSGDNRIEFLHFFLQNFRNFEIFAKFSTIIRMNKKSKQFTQWTLEPIEFLLKYIF